MLNEEGLTVDDQERYIILEDTVRQGYASVVWSHKIQEKQADVYAKQFKDMETLKIIAASLTSAGIITTIFVDGLWVKIVASLLSFVTIYINSYFKSFNLQNLVSQHKSAANNLLRVRERLLILLMQTKTQLKTISELSADYEEIMGTLNAVYVDAPTTTDKAVSSASIALKQAGDNTYSDEEIDRFLPKGLRKDD